MKNYSLLTDAYEYAMADAYLKNNKENVTAVFDVFFRKVPNEGGYCIMAGLDKIIDYVNNLHFDQEDLDYLKSCGYSDKFINYLTDYKFKGSIYAIPDGTPVFPNEPLVTVVAPIVDAQIVETAILSLVNGSMEHATGARRIIEACPEGVGVMEFGARRADGLDAANDASYYGMMAGCIGTSNVMTAKRLGIKPLGTMAHSFVETFNSELEAFKAFADAYPNNCTLLIDTYDTLKSGLPNAIKTFQYMQQKGMPTDHIGVRIDSGDLAYLSKMCRAALNVSGFPQAKICLSNGLKAEIIGSLVLQGAKFDTLGVGDNISKPEGRMGAVYKEVAIIEDGVETPKIKLSNDIFKVVNPAYKKLYRLYSNESGFAVADVMCEHTEVLPEDEIEIVSLKDYYKSSVIENFVAIELQKEIFKDGVQVYNEPSFADKKAHCEAQMGLLFPEVKRIFNPHEYYVDGTVQYVKLKQDMIKKGKGK